MYELNAYFTNDGSVGLFSPSADDIYHSTYGALTEAYEKFILPADIERHFTCENNKTSLNVLDICFGIGYNTKSFLNYFLEEKFHEKNPSLNLNIDAIDTDKILLELSPFFVRENKNKFFYKQEKLPQHEKIEKISKLKTQSRYKLKQEVNVILLISLLNSNKSSTEASDFINKINSPQYFDPYMINLCDFLTKKGYSNTPKGKIKHFLHNIYYRNITKCYKNALKTTKDSKITFRPHIIDARTAILNEISPDTKYDYIFLDAFSPTKCPCLWTVDFFRLLHERLDENGIILTYSNAANVRNAFLQAGFCVGKTTKNGKQIGTVAVKNPELIKTPLSEYDLGLLNTKAGVIYRDENLNASNEAIIERHSMDVKNSGLISSSKYIKGANKGGHSNEQL